MAIERTDTKRLVGQRHRRPITSPASIFASLCGGRCGVARIRSDVLDGSVDHPVALERKGCQLQPHDLARVDEPDVLVVDPHLGFQSLAVGHHGHQHGARLDDRADGVSREVLDDARLRRLQLEELLSVGLLAEFLRELLELGLDFVPLGMEADAGCRTGSAPAASRTDRSRPAPTR
jgi:hypothetical protein